jgi:hypothetical protein
VDTQSTSVANLRGLIEEGAVAAAGTPALRQLGLAH